MEGLGRADEAIVIDQGHDVLWKRLSDARRMLTGPAGAFEVGDAVVLGRPNRVYRHAEPHLRAVWQSTRTFSDRPYLVYQNERLTYAQAHELADAIAAWLYAQGVHAGQRVGISMRNYPEWMLIYWACVSMGVTVVGFNAWWTAAEMAYALADSNPAFLFVDLERLDRAVEARQASATTRIICTRAASLPETVIPWSRVIENAGAMPDVEIDPDDDACIFYTSGTTGAPKGAQLTHRGCVANIHNQLFSAACTALATGQPPPADAPAPTVLITTPLFHVTANNCGVQPVTRAGGKVVLMHKWDPAEALKLIARERVTRMTGVPLMSRELVLHPDFAGTDVSSLTALSGGGAQVPPDLVLKIAGLGNGVRPSTGYGMTETCGVITSVTGEFFAGKPESAGPYLPNFEVRCVDDQGQDCAIGEIGELHVRGSSVIKGYLNKPEATAEAIVDGWLRTGDVARVDADGFVFIVDRKKDMVLRGGENVYCAEVEAALYRHPDVAECCVFGVPDDRLGEEVAAVLHLRPGATAEADMIQAACAEHIARHKVPRYVWLRSGPLPRNASGKFLKRELKEQFLLDNRFLSNRLE